MKRSFNSMAVGADEALIGPTSTRKMVNAILVANGAPSVVTDGFDVSNWAAVLLGFVSAVGTSFDAKIWFWDDAAQSWWLYTDFGTAGIKTVATATNSGIYHANAPTFGASRIYVEVLNFIGAGETATVTGRASSAV